MTSNEVSSFKKMINIKNENIIKCKVTKAKQKQM